MVSILAEIERGEVWDNSNTKNSLVSLGKYTQMGTTKWLSQVVAMVGAITVTEAEVYLGFTKVIFPVTLEVTPAV